MVNQGHIAKFYVVHEIMDDNIDRHSPLSLKSRMRFERSFLRDYVINDLSFCRLNI